jgi:putative aminopeptidase
MLAPLDVPRAGKGNGVATSELGPIKGQLKETLRALTALDGVAGQEMAVVRSLKERFAPLADEVVVDRMGNVLATKRGGDGPHLVISAHSDEIGGLVTAIEPDGKIRFAKNGGVIETLLVARKVRVGNVPGIVGVKAGHLQRPDEQRTVPPIRDLYIDVGYDTAAEVAALGIRTGTPITYDAPLSALTNGDRVYGKAVDNRISCAILLQLLERLRGTTLNGTLTCAVAVQEEVGLRGAQVLAYRLNPDYIIVIDTMPSGDTPEMRMAQDANVRIGAGPVIRLMAGGGGGGGHHMPPQMVRLMLDTAESAGIPVQPVVLAGANTDAATMHLVREGIPTGVINLPRRYSHSPVEMLDLNDAAHALLLAEAIAKGIGTHRLEFLD